MIFTGFTIKRTHKKAHKGEGRSLMGLFGEISHIL